MRRAYTIGAPSIFVNKNGLGRFPQFRDQGVGGSNPLSPTNLSWNQSITSKRSVIWAPRSAVLRSTSPSSFPFLINDLAATMKPWVTTRWSNRESGRQRGPGLEPNAQTWRFAGAFTPVLAKHSKSFSLIDCISVGVDRMQRNFEPMRKLVEAWQRSELTEVTANTTGNSAPFRPYLGHIP
jgi:hypothetical protein